MDLVKQLYNRLSVLEKQKLAIENEIKNIKNEIQNIHLLVKRRR